MAFEVPSVYGPVGPIHGRQRHCCSAKADAVSRQPHATARTSRAGWSASDAEPLDQRLVAPFIGALEIIEQLAALGNELEQAASRMVIVDVRLEMLGQAGDPFREDRHLYFRRT